MTMQLKLPNIVFGGNNKQLLTDPMINSGSLLLIDPQSPLNPMSKVVIGGPVPNLAEGTMAALTGAQSEFSFMLSGFYGEKFIFELTNRGGIHVAVPTTITQGRGWHPSIGMLWPQELLDYLNNNPTHQLYISTWTSTSRLDSDAVDTPFMNLGTVDNTTNYRAIFDIKSDLPTGASRLGYFKSGTDTVGEGTMRAIAVNSYAGIEIPYYTNFVFGTGPMDRPITEGQTGKWPAMILYRLYVEDLTVSGNTFDNVVAKDKALYQKDVMTAGGRYYGDTYTDPATIG